MPKSPSHRPHSQRLSPIAPQVPANSTQKKIEACLPYLVLFLAALFVYMPALSGERLWDDNAHITKPQLQPLLGLFQIWADPHATQQYYPLLHSAFWFEHRIWADSTLCYHLLNLALHFTAACLLACLMSLLGLPGGLLAAGLFLLHPIEVESVAWISEQKNTLSTVFYLSAFILYLKHLNSRAWSWYILASAAFICAFLCKSVTVTLPAALLLTLWWRNGKISFRADVLPLIPWFILGFCSGLFTAWVERHLIGANGSEWNLTPAQRILLACRVPFFYASKYFWPTHFAFIYPRWNLQADSLRQYMYVALIVLVLSGCAAAYFQFRRRAPLALLALYLAALFPALGFFNVYPFQFSFVADHFQYLASLYLAAAAASGLSFLLKRQTALIRSLVPVAILAALGVITFHVSANYKTDETLFSSTLALNPSSSLAYDNLGQYYTARHRSADALHAFREAVRLQPDNFESVNNMGVLLAASGNDAEAIDAFEHALRLKPTSASAENNLGRVLCNAGDLADGINHLLAALKLQPEYPDAECNLGVAFIKAHDLPSAAARFANALKLQPGSVDAHNGLGTIAAIEGRYEAAAQNFQAALQADPANKQARMALAKLKSRGAVN